MKITADHAFHIGSQHLRGGMPCQDYALSEVGGDTAIAVISDGCSSAGRTDIGARIIATTFATAIRQSATESHARKDWIQQSVRWRRAAVAELLELREIDLLATCAYISACASLEDIQGLITLYGDGVVATVDHYGHISMSRYDWDGNAPFYPAYSNETINRFVDEVHGDWLRMGVTLSEHWRPADDGLARTDDATRISVGDGLIGFDHNFATPSIRLAAVFSDGVTQVDGMDWRDVVAELMAFKSTEGDFVKRRMNRFLKDCLQHGKGPIDDISMACIHINHEVA